MKKATLLCAALALVIAPAVANAQSASFFLDERDSIAEINAPSTTQGYANEAFGGGRGDGQVIRVTPKINPGVTDDHITGRDLSLETMTLYVDYSTLGDPNEVLSSVGIDFAIGAPAVGERGLLSATGTIFNLAAEVGSANDPWNATSISTAFTTSGGGIKMVRVPVAAGAPPVFQASLGITEGNGYRLARIQVEGDNCNLAGCTPALGVSMSVNNLLITQVSNPGPSAAVNVNFGYAAGAAEAAGSGSTAGTTSATSDATVVVAHKGDFNGDGNFNGLDLGQVGPNFSAALAGTANRGTVWTGDWNGDESFNGLDLGAVGPYFSAVLASCATCP